VTESEYLDPNLFPVTTQGNLTLHSQQMLDAHNLDELEAELRAKRPLDDEQRRALRELRDKAAF
jgi:hypothetical protein